MNSQSSFFLSVLYVIFLFRKKEKKRYWGEKGFWIDTAKVLPSLVLQLINVHDGRIHFQGRSLRKRGGVTDNPQPLPPRGQLHLDICEQTTENISRFHSSAAA